MYVCICKQVTDSQIISEVQRGASSLDEISERLGASTQCGKCSNFAHRVINEALQDCAYDACFSAAAATGS